MTNKVLKCKCKHEFQDKEYGEGMRLHNENSKFEYVCTVCNSKVKQSTVK